MNLQSLNFGIHTIADITDYDQVSAVSAQVSSFSFGRRNVLRHVNLSVQRGETIALLGPSGCGKSTLIKLLAGLLPRDDQHIFDGGVKLFGSSPVEYRATGKLSVMFQDPTLLPHLNVEQNIRLPLQLLRQEEERDTAAMLKLVGLADFKSYLPRDLSGGMRTRAALARAFITEPHLLFLDEPFTGLDLSFKQSICANLQELRSRYNTTIVMVTHDLEEAIYNSDRLIVMTSQGTILEELCVPGEFPRSFSFGETVSRHTSLLSSLAKALSNSTTMSTDERA